MGQAIRFLLTAIAILTLATGSRASIAATGADRTRVQFKAWYPQYGFVFQQILEEDCTDQYNIYLYGQKSNTTIDWYSGADSHTEFVEPLANCILNNSSQYISFQLQTAQIILGLTPTVLAVLGASSDETATLTVVGKRPLLAFLLAAASPSLFTHRAFDHRDPRGILKKREYHLQYSFKGGKGLRCFIVFIEYIFVLAALANVATITWELGTRAICSLAAEIYYLPLTWALLGICVHGVGVILFRIRARRGTQATTLEGKPSLTDWRHRFRQELHEFLPYELGWYYSDAVYVLWFKESMMYIAGSWFLSIGTVAHIIYGTLVFSGLLFIGPRDATSVLGRYMASILICRIILKHELAILRDRYNVGLQNEREAHKKTHENCQHLVSCYECGGKKDEGHEDSGFSNETLPRPVHSKSATV
jgi:hypothetical protein